jgi:hypothetical protein
MKPDTYVYVYKLDDTFYIQSKGDEDELVVMMASAIVSDSRLVEASNVAIQYLTNFGAENQN